MPIRKKSGNLMILVYISGKTMDYLPSRPFLYKYGTPFYYSNHDILLPCLVCKWLTMAWFQRASLHLRLYPLYRVEFIAQRLRSANRKILIGPSIFWISRRWVSIWAGIPTIKRPCLEDAEILHNYLLSSIKAQES